MIRASDLRTYRTVECVSFRSTKEKFGGLSNMAGGFPLRINGVLVLSAEAIYQACRFPRQPDIQKLIIEQCSPMTAKMVSKPHRGETRRDWNQIRVRVMRWTLRVKLAMHWPEFGGLILATGDRPIVEDSRRDDFWGALPGKRHTGGYERARSLANGTPRGSSRGRIRNHCESWPRPDSRLPVLGAANWTGWFWRQNRRCCGRPGCRRQAWALWGSRIDGPEAELDEEPAVAASIATIEDQPTRQEGDDRRMRYPKRSIEVDLPIKRIFAHARREKDMRLGHIPSLHIYPAARPPAACRAVICAALWPDPADQLCPPAFRQAAESQIRAFANSAATNRGIMEICDNDAWKRYGELAKNGKAIEPKALRELLLYFIADFAAWEASTDPIFLQTARSLTQAAHEAWRGSRHAPADSGPVRWGRSNSVGSPSRWGRRIRQRSEPGCGAPEQGSA